MKILWVTALNDDVTFVGVGTKHVSLRLANRICGPEHLCSATALSYYAVLSQIWSLSKEIAASVIWILHFLPYCDFDYLSIPCMNFILAFSAFFLSTHPQTLISHAVFFTCLQKLIHNHRLWYIVFIFVIILQAQDLIDLYLVRVLKSKRPLQVSLLPEVKMRFCSAVNKQKFTPPARCWCF